MFQTFVSFEFFFETVRYGEGGGHGRDFVSLQESDFGPGRGLEEFPEVDDDGHTTEMMVRLHVGRACDVMRLAPAVH